ncbi:hypothetical protein NM74_08000 [Aeromonas hydrophila]|uniref:hypothetical protein n=1 Tax=Aeromonas hydrophila TaxID=644 RepID=UPI000536B0FB|nr:hypothetical protein [Aeromonas hydrophila]KHA57148.1 hypothetical protein NM74_08000 [Aeromonas hydrophila]
MSSLFVYGVIVVAFAVVDFLALIFERVMWWQTTSQFLWWVKLGINVNIIVVGSAIVLTAGEYIP